MTSGKNGKASETTFLAFLLKIVLSITRFTLFLFYSVSDLRVWKFAPIHKAADSLSQITVGAWNAIADISTTFSWANILEMLAKQEYERKIMGVSVTRFHFYLIIGTIPLAKKLLIKFFEELITLIFKKKYSNENQFDLVNTITKAPNNLIDDESSKSLTLVNKKQISLAKIKEVFSDDKFKANNKNVDEIIQSFSYTLLQLTFLFTTASPENVRLFIKLVLAYIAMYYTAFILKTYLRSDEFATLLPEKITEYLHVSGHEASKDPLENKINKSLNQLVNIKKHNPKSLAEHIRKHERLVKKHTDYDFNLKFFISVINKIPEIPLDLKDIIILYIFLRGGFITINDIDSLIIATKVSYDITNFLQSNSENIDEILEHNKKLIDMKRNLQPASAIKPYASFWRSAEKVKNIDNIEIVTEASNLIKKHYIN